MQECKNARMQECLLGVIATIIECLNA